jgi:hypothetical protein
MKKLLSIIVLSLLLSGNAYAKIIILSKCFQTAVANEFDTEVYEKQYYKVDTNQKTLAHISVITDEWLKNSSSKSKIIIEKYDLDYYDDDYVVGLDKKQNKTFRYTLDLKKKIVEIYIIEEKKILTYHKCESNKL